MSFDWREELQGIRLGLIHPMMPPDARRALERLCRAVEAVVELVPDGHCCKRHPDKHARISDAIEKALR